MAENEDKTESGTARRREKAREQGQSAKSRELITMSTTGGILLVMYMTGASFMQNLTGLTGRLLGLRYGRDSMAVVRSASVEMALILVPILIAAVAFAVLSNVVQTGIMIKPLTMSFDKLNPLTGFQNLFSISALPGIIKSFVKFVVGVVVFTLVINKVIVFIPMTAAMDLGAIQTVTFGLTGKAILYIFTTFFVIALIDYGIEWWKFERSVKMSRDEVKQEFRESEGDPLIKAKIKSIQREAARRRMMESVPKATVVITNPTHLAVALQYKKDNAAPRVVAKGKGYIAENIRTLARRHGIPIVEDKPLARALFKVDLDSVIPADLYRAVAKILAYIFKLRGTAAS